MQGSDGTVWRVVAPLYAATLVCAVCRGAVFLLVPIEALQSGGLFSGFAVPGMLAVGATLVNVPAALAVARYGAKRVMVFGLGAGLLSAITLAMTSSVLWMAMAAFLHGLGLGVWGLAQLIHLTETVPMHLRGRAIAPLGGMFRVGMFVSPWLAGYSAEAFGAEKTLLGVTACIALAFGIVVAFVRPVPSAPESRAAPPWVRVFHVLREHRGPLLTAGGAMAALALLRAARLLLIPVCGTVLGLDTSEVGFVKSSSAFADTLLFYPAGQVMDRAGRKWTALPCLLTMSAGVVLLSGAESYQWFFLGAVVAGVGNGMGAGINMTLAGDFAPARGRADFIGVWRLFSDSGAAISPFVMGSVAQLLSLGATGVVSGVVGVLGAILLQVGVREPLRRRAERR